MKIVIAAEIFPPDIGGPATYSNKLAKELTNRDWKIKLICYSSQIENDNHSFPISRILRGQSTLKRYWQYFWHLLKLANKDCDSIFTQGPVSSGLPAIVVGFLLSKKVVVKVVGDYAWEQARNLGQTEIGIDEFQKQNPTGKIGWLKKIEKFTCQKASKVIVPSEYLKGIVSGWGVDENKIEVVYNSFDSRELDWVTDDHKDKNRIISIGRLVPWKGFEMLISLMSELIRDNPDFNLLILGEGPDQDKLEGLIFKLKLNDRIAIKSLPHQEVLTNIQLSGMFILNTGYEGLSHVVLEAMGVGTPVITTNIGGNPELVTNQENGLLVEYNNKDQLKEAILRIYNDPELRQKLVNNSKEVLKKFTKEQMIEDTIKVLQSK